MKKRYLVVIVVLFISTSVFTLLHSNTLFCWNSPECNLSHVLSITPDGKYAQTAPPSVSAACQTLPGRGLGENDPLD
ncbi:hypothetical protein BVD23_09730 [Salmonella enterica]|nr:hypothetical protein [Salmonella enterica]EAX8455208.1 hypothetical protein [Salmonella enterica]EAX8552523.1 hypothetical protein [Salmonella enterica]EAX8595182.1 hypothetical protein [Salmonella enterica]EAX8617779.1 hypothetical protein [Salmonella enterica]